MEALAEAMPLLMFAGLAIFLFSGYPVAFVLGGIGLIFALPVVTPLKDRFGQIHYALDRQAKCVGHPRLESGNIVDVILQIFTDFEPIGNHFNAHGFQMIGRPDAGQHQ